MSIENAEKKKLGRKPKANPQKNRLMIRLNDEDHKRFCRGLRRLMIPETTFSTV